MPTRIAKYMLYYVLLAFVGLCIYAGLSGHAQAAETAVTASQGLEGALVDIIQQVSGGVKQGVSFLQQEIPDVVKQLLIWNMTKSIVVATLLVAAEVAIVFGLIKAVKFATREDAAYNDDAVPLVYGMFGGFTSLFVVGFAIEHGLNALQIYIAPKLWLIEYAAHLVK